MSVCVYICIYIKKGSSESNLGTGKCAQANFNIQSIYFGACV